MRSPDADADRLQGQARAVGGHGIVGDRAQDDGQQEGGPETSRAGSRRARSAGRDVQGGARERAEQPEPTASCRVPVSRRGWLAGGLAGVIDRVLEAKLAVGSRSRR